MRTAGSTGCIFCSDGKREARWMTRRSRGCPSFSKIYTQRGEGNVQGWESLSEEAKRRTSRWKWERDDQNWERELSIVVGEAEWEKRGREEAGGRQEYMKASCINGKVKIRLRINYPVSPGITNVIIWTRVLIRMCRGVEDLRNKMGDRDGAARV